MDRELVAALRDWSRESAAECEQSFRASGPTVESGTLKMMYRRFRALDTLVNEHQVARIAVRVSRGSRLLFDGALLSAAQETPNYGAKVRALASEHPARTAITLEVRLR